MKKTTKALLAISAIVAAPIIINHVINKKAQQRIVQKAALQPEDANVFSWEYGDINYVIKGPQNAVPLLLIHGIYPGASTLEWQEAISHFAEDYRVYAIDLLGFGYSSKPALDYSSYLYVRLVKDFIENVIGRPTIAAASLHSATALISCAALNPEDFESIVLVSPVGLECATQLAQEEDEYIKKTLETPIAGTSFYNALSSKRALSKFFVKESLADEEFMDAETLDKIYLAAHAGGSGGKHAMAALLSKYFNTDVKQCLSDLTIPNHIILGEQFDGAESVFNLWQGVDEQYQATTIDGAGLLPHMISPAIFHEAVSHLI